MNILFTGASSFTGYWFAKLLAEGGHHVTCTYTGASVETYNGARRERVELLSKVVAQEFATAFGDDRFMQLLKSRQWDVLAHHAAYVQNYKEADFNVLHAVNSNANNVFRVMAALAEGGCKSLVVTGSVFEGGEGAGSDGLPHFSPYGLSKHLSAEIFKYYANYFKMKYGKFVIPNPFGPLEEPRFTAYLMKNWLSRQTPKVNTPDYVRDNIHVLLLAKYYRHFCEAVHTGDAPVAKLSPTGMVSSQGIFTQTVAREVSSRLNIPCDFVLEKQVNFTEPLVRTGIDHLASVTDAFTEKESWDSFVDYYVQKLGVKAN